MIRVRRTRDEVTGVRYGVDRAGPRLAFRRTYYDRCGSGGGSGDAGPSERSTSEMRPRLHSFGGAGAFHCAPLDLRAPAPVDARPFGG